MFISWIMHNKMEEAVGEIGEEHGLGCKILGTGAVSIGCHVLIMHDSQAFSQIRRCCSSKDAIFKQVGISTALRPHFKSLVRYERLLARPNTNSLKNLS